MGVNREPLVVHLEQFHPQGSVDHERNEALIWSLTGEPGREFKRLIGDRKPVPEELHTRVNQFFYNAYPGLVGVPGNLPPDRFWQRKEEGALRVHQTIVSQLPGVSDEFELITEGDTCTGRITDYLEVLYGEEPKRYQHEIRRKLLLSLVSAQLEGQDLRIGLTRKLQAVESVFKRDLFPEGTATRPRFIHAYHNPLTNKVLGFGLGKHTSYPDSIERVHKFNVRKTGEEGKAGLVYYKSRAKGYPEATIKAVDRAIKNGGLINTSDVKDWLGAMWVLINPRIRPNYLHKMILEVLKANFGKIVVDKDDQLSGYKKDTNDPIKWTRRQYSLPGFDHPFEGIVFRTAEYLDYMYELGVSTDPRDIKARDIYQIFRLGQVAKLLYPNEKGLYCYNLEEEISNEVRRARERILNSGLQNPVTIDFKELLLNPRARVSELIATGK